MLASQLCRPLNSIAERKLGLVVSDWPLVDIFHTAKALADDEKHHCQALLRKGRGTAGQGLGAQPELSGHKALPSLYLDITSAMSSSPH